ncbi:2-dehydropantoate 2-reductase [Cryobacterium lactosi]|uniref:2-dehydropantoate 2-reductase n=1 Tax=Cryobacterium lactosi TaxID=1259202 RepID=A0A4V3IXN8_9MICO|nr:2-dehydropantoate 2-reductase [Cryobacterium lactosi]TFD91715.1 2-dehydropantoate 2-reductase [Cryobacterium lactosi]
MSEPVIAIVGAGAVGGLLGVLLNRSGTDVVAVARPATARRINADGLTLHSPHFGDQVGRLPAVTEIPVGARVIVATKAYALPGLTDALRRAQPAEVVSLLNGIEHMDVLRQAAPDARVAGATIAVESTRVGPTVIDHRSPFLRLTVPAAAESTGIVTAWTSAGLEVTVGGTEAEVLWSKLRFLAPMALLTSYWRLPIGAAREHDPALTTAVLAEVAQIATRDGVPSDPVQLARAIHALPDGMRSSLQNDLETGAATELDAIGGALLRRARHHGVPAPRVQELVGDLGSRGAP